MGQVRVVEWGAGGPGEHVCMSMRVCMGFGKLSQEHPQWLFHL